MSHTAEENAAVQTGEETLRGDSSHPVQEGLPPGRGSHSPRWGPKDFPAIKAV